MRIREILLAAVLTATPLLLFATDDYRATENINVRSGPGTNYSVSFTLQKGDEVEVLSENGSWYEIKYLGKIGYAHSKYLKAIPNTEFNTSQQSDADSSGVSALMLLGLIGFFWLLPILVIMSSNKTTGSEKTAWILAVIFISWFSWIFYMLLAPIKKSD
jgi:hypothetical protein